MSTYIFKIVSFFAAGLSYRRRRSNAADCTGKSYLTAAPGDRLNAACGGK
ncbi:MAG: hypothetical protein KAW12_08710 [Candidatus Aminicenantes bacterium]|nr:hypothetical protein [Candidatus Aminicenantes bacterium]